MLIILFILAVMLIPFVILFGILGIAVDSVFDIFLLIIKYLFPGLLVGLFIAFKKADDMREGLLILSVALAINLVVAFAFFGLYPEPTLPEENQVASAVIFTEAHDKGKPVKSSRETFGTVPDPSILAGFLEDFEECKIHRTLREFIHPEEGTSLVGIQLLDAEGKVLKEVYVLGDNRIAIPSTLVTRYYSIKKDVGEIGRDTLKNLWYDYRESQINLLWHDFVTELEDSVYWKDNAMHFVIPENAPSEYELTTDLYCGYFDEATGKQMFYDVNIEWDHEEKQDWVPGTDYSFQLGDRRYRRLRLVLRVEGKTFHIDMRSKLPRGQAF